MAKKKLKDMTEPEKAAFFEQQRLAALAAAKKREDMLQLYLKNKLDKEEQLTRINTLKINHQWRLILRKAKTEEVKNDLNILKSTFERVNDRKNNILLTLAKELEESEEQYMMAMRAHLHNLDLLIQIQNQRLERMKNSFDDELAMMKNEFDTERAYMKDQHLKQINELKDIYVAFDKFFLRKETEARNEYGSTRDDMKNKALENKHALRMVLEKKVNTLWNEFQICKTNYIKSAEERRAFYEILNRRNTQAVKDIERQMIHLNEVNAKIITEKARIAKLVDEFGEKNRLLKEERDRLKVHFLDLKRQINQVRDKQFAKLTNLANNSNSAHKSICEMLKKAEVIITIGEQCRRLETESEKVLPFYTSCISKEEEEQLIREYEDEVDADVKTLLKRYAPLDIFWRRFNKVQLDRLALLKERKILEAENLNLKSLVSQYLDGLSVNDKVMSKPNSLLVINGNHNLTVDPALKDGKRRPVPTVTVEGVYVYKNRCVSNVK